VETLYKVNIKTGKVRLDSITVDERNEMDSLYGNSVFIQSDLFCSLNRAGLMEYFLEYHRNKSLYQELKSKIESLLICDVEGFFCNSDIFLWRKNLWFEDNTQLVFTDQTCFPRGENYIFAATREEMISRLTESIKIKNDFLISRQEEMFEGIEDKLETLYIIDTDNLDKGKQALKMETIQDADEDWFYCVSGNKYETDGLTLIVEQALSEAKQEVRWTIDHRNEILINRLKIIRDSG